MKFVLGIILLFVCTPLFAVQSIVVLPFSNESKKQEIYWLGEGFAESLSEEMLLKDAYFIERPERIGAYDNLRLPYIGGLSRATMLKLGQKLAADYVVFGTYNLKDSKLHVETQVINLSSSKLSYIIQAEGTLDKLYESQRQLKEGLKKYFLSERLVPVDPKQIVPNGGSLHAYELYIKGLLENSDAEKIKFFQRAIEANPQYQQALYRLGQSLFRLQRYKESNDYLRRITNAPALLKNANFLSGLNLYYSRDYAGAQQKWFELSQSAPSSEVFNNIGLTLLKKNDAQNALAWLNKAIETDSTNGDYEFNAASCYMQLKQDEQAKYHFRKVIDYRPNDYLAFYLIAKLLEKQSDPQAPRVYALFQESLPTDQKGKFPEQFTGILQLVRPAMSYVSAEEKAYKALPRKKWSEEKANYVKTYQSSARKWLEDGEPDKAILELKKGITLSPFDWSLYYLWGYAHNQQKNTAEAVRQLQFSLWCLDNIDSHLLLAEIYRDAQQFDQAKLQIQQIMALDPKNKKAMEIWGKIWNKK
jgi:tetratricopeptide (TPR) repeat protein